MVHTHLYTYWWEDHRSRWSTTEAHLNINEGIKKNCSYKKINFTQKTGRHYQRVNNRLFLHAYRFNRGYVGTALWLRDKKVIEDGRNSSSCSYCNALVSPACRPSAMVDLVLSGNGLVNPRRFHEHIRAPRLPTHVDTTYRIGSHSFVLNVVMSCRVEHFRIQCAVWVFFCFSSEFHACKLRGCYRWKPCMRNCITADSHLTE